MNSKIKKIIKIFDDRLLSTKKIDITETILIAGSPRSGTTWLMEMLGGIPSYRSLFEPLNPNRYPESFKIGFRSRTYRPIDMEWSDGEDYLRRTFAGKVFISDPKQFYINDPKEIFYSIFSNKIIVKEVRINRLLPWIGRRFKLKAIILLLRHPCAVISSQIKTGYTAYHPDEQFYRNVIPNIKNIIEEANKIDGLDQKIINKLKNLETPEERLAATWCLDTYLPLYTSASHPWMTIIYERCFQKGQQDIISIFNAIGQKRIPRAVLRNMKMPSRMTNKSEGKTIQSGEKQLAKWRQSLTEHQITRILRVVSDFGLDFYTKDAEPNYELLNKEKII